MSKTDIRQEKLKIKTYLQQLW